MSTPIMSQAVLVLETQNSVYGLTIGRSSSYVTCYKGTFAGEVERKNLHDLPTIVTDTWAMAVGQRASLGQDIYTASAVAHRALEGENFVIACDNAITTSRVEIARWVFTEREVMDPKHRTRLTANVFVSYGERDMQVPVTRQVCCACNEAVDLFARRTYSLSRVMGDSRWGYEPMHIACA